MYFGFGEDFTPHATAKVDLMTPSIRRLARFSTMFFGTLQAQQHELGLALQANYGYRLLEHRMASVCVETHVLANPRCKIRDFYTGSPAYNVVAGGGIVVRFR